MVPLGWFLPELLPLTSRACFCIHLEMVASLCNQLLLQFLFKFSETLWKCFIYIGNMHIEIWFHSDDFCQSYCPWLLELVFAFILRWYFHCVINSSYSFSSNFLKLAGNVLYTLVICILKYGSTRMIFARVIALDFSSMFLHSSWDGTFTV